jgi:hypothetical protein
MRLNGCSHLKCDAASPCFHCERRNIECVYITGPGDGGFAPTEYAAQHNPDPESMEPPTKKAKLADTTPQKRDIGALHRAAESLKDNGSSAAPPKPQNRTPKATKCTLPHFFFHFTLSFLPTFSSTGRHASFRAIAIRAYVAGSNSQHQFNPMLDPFFVFPPHNCIPFIEVAPLVAMCIQSRPSFFVLLFSVLLFDIFFFGSSLVRFNSPDLDFFHPT